MVGIAQLVELRIVIPAVVGSSPIVHPISRLFDICRSVVGVAQLVELRIVIPAVVGSSPIVHPIPITLRTWWNW